MMNTISLGIGIIFIIVAVIGLFVNLIKSLRKKSAVSEKEVSSQDGIQSSTVKDASLPSENTVETKIEIPEIKGEYKPLMKKIEDKIIQKSNLSEHIIKSKLKKSKILKPKIRRVKKSGKQKIEKRKRTHSPKKS